MKKYYQGHYKPKNPKKYAGDINEIIYRSGWELQLMAKFDQSDSVVLWNSEGLVVPYRSPLDGEMHRYFPDFLIKVRYKDGTFKTWLLEVKPSNQTTLRGTNRHTRKFLNEAATFVVNQAKWAAAEAFCKDQGWTFQVVTEKNHLFL